jgi:hypothetical protein
MAMDACEAAAFYADEASTVLVLLARAATISSFCLITDMFAITVDYLRSRRPSGPDASPCIR